MSSPHEGVDDNLPDTQPAQQSTTDTENYKISLCLAYAPHSFDGRSSDGADVHAASVAAENQTSTADTRKDEAVFSGDNVLYENIPVASSDEGAGCVNVRASVVAVNQNSNAEMEEEEVIYETISLASSNGCVDVCAPVAALNQSSTAEVKEDEVMYMNISAGIMDI